ncbi:hypothetical protein FOPE_10051 [Fonsecaea pedrosoi]|nr:hypothetical protein FOPE_10051 [Fonsecaea pedrosoi]
MDERTAAGEVYSSSSQGIGRAQATGRNKPRGGMTGSNSAGLGAWFSSVAGEVRELDDLGSSVDFGNKLNQPQSRTDGEREQGKDGQQWIVGPGWWQQKWLQ